MADRAAGILADHHISALFESGALKSTRPLDADQIQPASLDLRLGAKAYRVRASFMPGPHKTVMDKLERSGFLPHLTGKVFLSQHQALQSLHSNSWGVDKIPIQASAEAD